ncbi:MAG: hypothetical protein AAF821_05575 [Cyanobacteria bacterium P01_D01_bin.156]
MQQLQPPLKKTNPILNPEVNEFLNRMSLTPASWAKLRKWGIGLTALAFVGTATGVVYQRYGQSSLAELPLETEAIEGHSWVGEDITFEQIENYQFNVDFTLNHGDTTTKLRLQDIDLSLMIPTVPTMARDNEALTQWFLTEREFNRQRVIFETGSSHIQLPTGLGNYALEDISIALTNNCLGAGYWELAVYAQTETGNEKIYQGYFTFSRRAYADLVHQLNPTRYWQQARTMEAWPGFRFLSGLKFSLSNLRTVESEQIVPVDDLKSEEILIAREQESKAGLIFNPNGENSRIRTWEELRQTALAFQSFVPPGIYAPRHLWKSDFSQLTEVTQATARQIVSPLAEKSLTEVQLNFANAEGELRQFVVSGIDLAQVPQLQPQDYSDGVYMPLGFGTPFTQDYSELEQNRPDESPFFAVLLDSKNQVIDYRKDIGINGLVMHRDNQNQNLLHIYLMSYERITLIGHYTVDLSDVVL